MMAKSLEDHELYRETNLSVNGIYLRYPCDPLPDHVAALVRQVARERDSPGPSIDVVRQDRELYKLPLYADDPGLERHCAEKYFNTHIFPNPGPSDELQRTDKEFMAEHAVAGSPSARLKVGIPEPDALYGYNRSAAFQPLQQEQLFSMGTGMVANDDDLLYPFLAVELTGDGFKNSGSLWVATNRCLGGAASCVNMADRLNRQPRQCWGDVKDRPAIPAVTTTAFSVAMSATEARLYVAWKHDDAHCYMQQVECFALQRPEHYVEFRRYVRNILDWGRGERLREIREVLDALLEERWKFAAEAKARPPPSDGSDGSDSRVKKQRF